MERLIVLELEMRRQFIAITLVMPCKKVKNTSLSMPAAENGILSQLDKAGIPLESIHNIFVTHAHNDHILGMVWMIRMIATSMNKGTYDGTLTIYCHEELVHTIKTLTKLTVGKKFYKHFDERIVFHVIAHGDTIQILEILHSLISALQKENSLVSHRLWKMD